MKTQALSIINGIVWVPRRAQLEDHPIHIEGDRIVGLDGVPASGAEVIDARSRLVSPGLIDAHFHAYGVGLDVLAIEAMNTSYVTAHAGRRLRRALGRGFTTVRDVAGGDIGLARALDEGLLVGPRYLFTGRALSQTGGHGDPRPAELDLCCTGGHMCEVVDGVDGLRRAVRERFRTGAHAIKIFTSGGVVSPTDPLRLCQYSGEEVAAVCSEAARRDSYVASHAYSPAAIELAVANGVRTIEHGNLLDAKTAALMAGRGAFLVPTLVAYDAIKRRGGELGLSDVGLSKNLEVLEAGVASLAVAAAAGVPIGLGSDLMGDLENEQLQEFRIRIEGGVGVADVLRSATAVNAEIIGRPDLASLEIDTPADLVIFNGNPFEDPSVLWDETRTVIAAGQRI